MPRWVALTVAMVAVAGLAPMVLTMVGSHRWRQRTAQQERALLLSARPDGHRHVDFRDFQGLPPPVARYLRLVLRDGQPIVQVARFSEHGRLRTSPQSERWMRFEARQVVAPPAIGFLWDATIRLAPGLHLQVRDSYMNGQGLGQASLQSTFSMGEDRGTPALNAGELYRFLAEGVWYPTALLPGPALTWTAIDDARSLATLRHGELTVSVEFRFNGAGEVTGIYAASRPRLEGKTYQMTPWEGHFAGYVAVEGLRVPSRGEVGWHMAGAWRSVWEGTVTDLRYELEKDSASRRQPSSEHE